jgi:hypothetical protein
MFFFFFNLSIAYAVKILVVIIVKWDEMLIVYGEVTNLYPWHYYSKWWEPKKT